MISTSTIRKSASLAGGAALAAVLLTGCGSITINGDGDAGTDFFGNGGFAAYSSEDYATASDATDAIKSGTLPAELPHDATDIVVATGGDRVFASWRGEQAPIDSCRTSSESVPTPPEQVAHQGTPTKIADCGDGVHQATVGDFTYYWSLGSK
ncbi:hypothetical protein [Frondihabitans cladoniiphilus]